MNRLLALIITLGVLIVLAFSCLFVVDQRQYAVVFALGEIKRVINEPGLYMKLPSPLQDVRYFDKRTLTYDSDEIDRFITAEKINIQVDSFVKWRIADPRQFFVSVGHSPQAADDRIGRQLRSALNNEIARLSVADVISSARETLVKQVMKVMSVELEKIGVTIVDVRLKRVDFAPEVAERVYERMRSERTRVANERRAKGAAEGERIRADADRQRRHVESHRYRRSNRIRLGCIADKAQRDNQRNREKARQKTRRAAADFRRQAVGDVKRGAADILAMADHAVFLCQQRFGKNRRHAQNRGKPHPKHRARPAGGNRRGHARDVAGTDLGGYRHCQRLKLRQ